MKNCKKFFALAIALIMVLSLSVSAFADGNDGSVTITNAKTGTSYSLVKVFDLTYDGDNVAYTYTAGENDAFLAALTSDASPFVLTQVNDSNVYNVALKEGKTATQVTDFLNAQLSTIDGDGNRTVKDGVAVVDTKTAAGQTVEFTGLAYGYYYVVSSLGANVTIDSTLKDVQVIDKNSTQDLKKYIVDADGNKVAVDDANVGDPIKFQIEVPLYQYDGTEQISEYYLYDKAHEGFTYNNDLKAYKNEVADANLFTGYTPEVKDGYIFFATIPMQAKTDNKYNGNFLYDNNDVIIFTYTMTLNEALEVDSAMVNEAELKWTTDKDNPVPPEGEGVKRTTESFTTDVDVVKVDKDGNRLTGAKFKFEGTSISKVLVYEEKFVLDQNGTFWALNDGTYTTTDPNGENIDKTAYKSVTDKYAKTVVNSIEEVAEAVGYETVVGDDGIVIYKGLGEGEYTITETEAPKGYNKLEKPINLVITFDAADKEFTAKYSFDGETYTELEEGQDIVIDVVNNSGAELPETGGIGTTIFYVLGAVLVAGAVVILLTRKKLED